MMRLEVDPRARALIFDVDGTLADSMPIHYLAWKMTSENHGILFSEEQFYELAGVPTPKIAQIILQKESIDPQALELAHEKEQKYLEMMHLMQPVAPVLDIVKKYKGLLPIGAGSGSPKDVVMLSLEALGIADCFQAVVTYEEVEHPKPAPDTFLKCAALLNVEPEYCQVFEDGEPGLVAARAAGMIVTDIRPFLRG
jgi:beta-phosphoglucomutase-like phosphatase (HAD superfamily)